MRRIIQVLAIFVLLALGIRLINRIPTERAKGPATHYPSTATFRNAIAATKKITVLISVEEWQSWDRGTGVLLDSTHLLTCYHVVKDEGNMMLVYFYPGRTLAHGKTVYYDEKHDLAVVEIDTPAPTHHYAKFTTTTYDGEPIVAVGNALGSLQWFVNYGIVSGSNSECLYSDNLIVSGDSGGPWIDNKGDIVALSAWGLDGASIDGGIAAHVINDFLAAYKKSLEVKK